MPKSMTGYGKSRLEGPDFTQVWEVRGVNSRFLDLKWRLPLFARSKENALEKVVREYVARGRVEVHLDFQTARPDILGVGLNRPLAKAMLAELAALAAETGQAFTPDLTRLLGIAHLWRDDVADLDPGVAEALAKGLREALADFDRSRRREGEHLKGDIAERLGRMRAWRAELENLAPRIKEEKTQAMLTRLKTALEGTGVAADPDRIIQEAAVMADRLDVSEELTRLSGHLDRMDALLGESGEAGKRLDFLIQETFREINTLGNKAQNSEASRVVVEFKAELEKCREQAQNIE